MKTRRVLSGVLLVLALALALGTVAAVGRARSAQPVMGQIPEEAVRRAEAMISAACAGDYPGASRYLYGSPSLGEIPEDASPGVKQIWEAFQESLSYEFPGECYMTDSGLTLDVKLRYLDVNEALAGLDARTEALLEQHVQAAQDSEELYDENHNFRQELIDQILEEAVSQVLAEDQTYGETTIALQLVFDREQWWVMPDSALLEILAGAVT